MASLTLKNIPDELYGKLKDAAQAHHRSLNSEILYCVECILTPRKIDVSEHVLQARALRAKTVRHPINNDVINAAKSEGRP